MSQLKTICLLLIFYSIVSCNRRKDGIESDIKNPPTSADTVLPATKPEGDSIQNDASRLSTGKDSVKGEITPPNAKNQ
ncbi:MULTISPECIES: hypothetical protein [Flavobacterium]|jgi:hypothetical protein|uniref:Lipoprotein n=1 Tax=Flavobacterium lindanitolerans TaxID=428988 RepID=A0A497UHA4_9FLAO|nr:MULTISPECIES: hypothetical protein [Flavobacterium]MDQ7962011.1 hypothetical protein [Flavobacterium lindanitolerans]PKW21131.1 hypothetical protein B0G92_2415 [Flavobacterium lindanitolerans]RLJ30231.1 hypothetical protein CLV50_1635 [Flavobacterium lindanitolerans]